MYAIADGKRTDLPDVVAFIDLLNRLPGSSLTHSRSLFDFESGLILTRAPGRLDVMGGIADYSGSLVLELPIKEATLVALQLSDERTLKIVSINPTSDDEIVFEMHLNDFEDGGAPLNYEAARRYFGSESSKHWAAYVAGAFLVLMRERQIRFPQGARMLVSSR